MNPCVCSLLKRPISFIAVLASIFLASCDPLTDRYTPEEAAAKGGNLAKDSFGPDAPNGKRAGLAFVSVDEFNDHVLLHLTPGTVFKKPIAFIYHRGGIEKELKLLPSLSTNGSNGNIILVAEIDRHGFWSYGVVRVQEESSTTGSIDPYPNTLPLRAWSGTITLTQRGPAGTLLAKARMKVRFRGTIGDIGTEGNIFPKVPFPSMATRDSTLDYWEATGTGAGQSWTKNTNVPFPRWDGYASDSWFGATLSFRPVASRWPIARIIAGVSVKDGITLDEATAKTINFSLGSYISSEVETINGTDIPSGSYGDGDGSTLVEWTTMVCECD